MNERYIRLIYSVFSHVLSFSASKVAAVLAPILSDCEWKRMKMRDERVLTCETYGTRDMRLCKWLRVKRMKREINDYVSG